MDTDNLKKHTAVFLDHNAGGAKIQNYFGFAFLRDFFFAYFLFCHNDIVILGLQIAFLFLQCLAATIYNCQVAV
jgi:hypothetical protein